MDQCTHCTLRGNINECRSTPCSQHESWYAIKQQEEIDSVKAFFLSKVTVSPEGEISLPLYVMNSREILDSLNNLNKLIQETINEH